MTAASIRCPQPIPDARLGQHELRALRIGFDLLPELAPRLFRRDQGLDALGAHRAELEFGNLAERI